jgi:L-fucono-1,5-lactonase
MTSFSGGDETIDPMTAAIDAHVHLWDPARVELPWLRPEHAAIGRAFLPDDLEPLLGDAGVDRVIVVQSACDDADTDLLLELAAAWPRIAGLVVWVPLEEPERCAARLDELPPVVRGVRHLIHDEKDPHWILRPAVLESLRLLEERGLVLELPVVWPGHLADIPKLAQSFAQLTIVIDHLGKPPLDGELGEWGRALDEAAAYPNAAAKVSGLNTATARDDWTADVFANAFATALAAFGRERLVCGSDWPVALLNGDYARVWRETRLLVGDDDRLLAANAIRLYGLPEGSDGTH